ncbi:MAG: hypothetical protein ACLS8R_09915 [Anaeromassilibacillus sp.]
MARGDHREILAFERPWRFHTLEWNPGGHFRAIPERFLRAIDWLCGQSF